MDKDIQDDFARVVASGAGQPVEIYMKARLDELKSELIVVNEDTFRITQGRALEIKRLIEFIDKLRG